MNPRALSTASTWARETTAATSGVAKAHSSDTLLGQEKVASKAKTLRSLLPSSRLTPLRGCKPSTSERSSPASTMPCNPRVAAQRPCHTPGASPAPR